MARIVPDIQAIHNVVRKQKHTLANLNPVEKRQGEMTLRCESCGREGEAVRTNQGRWKLTGPVVDEECTQ